MIRMIVKQLKKNRRGQTAVEYALIVGVLAIALIGAVKGLILPMFQEEGEAAKAIQTSIMQAAGAGQSK